MLILLFFRYLFIDILSFLGEGLNLNQIFSAALIVFTAGTLLVKRIHFVFISVVLILIVSMPTLFNYGLIATAPLIFRWLLLVLSAAYLSHNRRIKVSKLLTLLKILIVANSFLVALQVTGVNSINIQGITRFSGMYGNPNLMGIHMAVYSLILIQLRKRKTGLIKYVALATVMLFLSGSLTSLFSFSFGILYKYRPPIIVSGLILILATSYVGPAIVERLSIVINLETGELTEASSVLWRFKAWSIYLADIDSIPKVIFGNGLGSSRLFLIDESLPFRAPGTHNDYIAIFYDLGLVGLGVFLIILMNILRQMNDDSKILIYVFLVGMFWDNYIDTVLMIVVFYYYKSIKINEVSF